MDLIHPHSEHDLRDALATASAEGTRLVIVGGRTHMDKGNPTEPDAEIWTTLLDGVVSYDPAEMIAVVEAGTRIRDLKVALAEGGQEWPVDAPDDSTVGGVIAAGAETVRTLRVGTMRDTVAELHLVTGDGRWIRTGARTVKNVTGFDVHRLMTGSLGTLGCIARVALKVRPLPKATMTLVATGDGMALGRKLLEGVPLPAAILAEPDRVTLRLEGWPEEVAEQAALARGISTMEERDPAGFPELPDGAEILAELSVPPSRLGDALAGMGGWTALMGIGRAWAPLGSIQELASLRTRAAELGGIAPVARGEGGLGDAPATALDVQRRIKRTMDPAGILAPGRFWHGI